MKTSPAPNYPQASAFEGPRLIARGPLDAVALQTKAVLDAGGDGPVLIFDDATGHLIDLDWRGTPRTLLQRLSEQFAAPAAALPDTDAPGPRCPGRPKLGVVAREVTLLPRHWDWLAGQTGGASVALRRLVDAARHANEGPDRLRRAQERCYRFISAVGGNLRGFEEVSRALFAVNAAGYKLHTRSWPRDLREHARELAAPVFAAPAVSPPPAAPP